jgi:hypothetical protein
MIYNYNNNHIRISEVISVMHLKIVILYVNYYNKNN